MCTIPPKKQRDGAVWSARWAHNPEVDSSNLSPATKIKIMKYIFVLDFMDGQVYRYDMRSISMNEEDYLSSQGHSLSNIEWMSTDNPEVITD